MALLRARQPVRVAALNAAVPHLPQILLGLLLAGGVSLAAFRARALSVSGAFAAWAVGATVFGLGGWAWAVPLLVFFGTSSGLSRWRRASKEKLGYEKGGRRDAGQVLANGGVAAACALLPFLFPRVTPVHAYGLFLAALAAANADTWGTEVGSALGGKPYDLRDGQTGRTRNVRGGQRGGDVGGFSGSDPGRRLRAGLGGASRGDSRRPERRPV